MASVNPGSPTHSTQLLFWHTFDFDVGEVGVYAEGQVARQRPGSGGPGNHTSGGVFVKWKVDDDYVGEGGGEGEGGGGRGREESHHFLSSSAVS